MEYLQRIIAEPEYIRLIAAIGIIGCTMFLILDYIYPSVGDD
jgi:hypothetical protein